MNQEICRPVLNHLETKRWQGWVGRMLDGSTEIPSFLGMTRTRLNAKKTKPEPQLLYPACGARELRRSFKVRNSMHTWTSF